MHKESFGGKAKYSTPISLYCLIEPFSAFKNKEDPTWVLSVECSDRESDAGETCSEAEIRSIERHTHENGNTNNARCRADAKRA